MLGTMKPSALPTRTELRGAARLATDATTGLTDLVEALHERIARLPGLAAREAGRTGGITGLVYDSVRGVTRLVGGSIDALLAALGPELAVGDDDPAYAREREAVRAALNGVLGDYLVSSGNPLATPMSLRLPGGAPLLPDGPASDATDRVLVLVHGLCMNDLQWQREGQDLGAALARELGFTPVYLRYNSGQHVSINGRAFSAQMQLLLQRWPRAVQRVVIVGHSMGGLVARSALHQATLAGLDWPRQLDDLVFLGTPHHGAPLERAGNWVDVLLGATPYAAPFARLGKLRSAGITDLRHGALLDEDWLGRDRFARGADRRTPVPLPAGVRCFAVGASLDAAPGGLKERVLGDGLVPLDSALGRHPDPARCLAFEPQNCQVVQGVGHLGLLSDAGVAAQLQHWLAPDA